MSACNVTATGGRTRILIIDDRAADEGRPDHGRSDDGPDGDITPFSGEWPVALLGEGAGAPAPSPGHLPVLAGGQTSPLVLRDLLSRIEDVITRARRAGSDAFAGDATGSAEVERGAWRGTFRCGPVELDPAAGTVLRAGAPVKVTGTEFRLLLALIRRRGAIASRGDLLREIWGTGTAVSRRVVDTHIARLRRKLEDDPAHPRHIVTALAWGYRFRA